MTLISLVLLIVGAIAGCVLWTLHYALRDITYQRLEEIADSNGGRGRIEPIVRDDAGHALAVALLASLASVSLVVGAIGLFLPADGSLPGAAAIVPGAALALAGVFVFCVLLPMSVADRAGERMIHLMLPLVRAVYFATTPVRSLWVIDRVIKRLAGEGDTTEAEELEEEIISVATEGEREGSITEAERKMIEAVIEFRSHTVEEIMTPRTEIEGFELTDDLEFIRSFIEKAGHSRIPVYEGDIDHIVGILYAKDLLSLLGCDVGSFRLRPLLREALFVPEVKPINELLVELQSRKTHMAIVLDEYGGTTGLVSIEDVLEEIVGEIRDEHEPEDEIPPAIEVVPESGSAEVDARAYIDDANEALAGISVAIPEGEEYDTVGGYVLNQLGHIPVAGERFRHDGFEVTVLESEPTRVTRLRIEVVPDESPAEQARPDAGTA